MKRITILLVLLSLQTLHAKEDFGRYDPNPSDEKAQTFRINLDVGYTVYLIDVTSSELSRAIDYTLYEATLGASYSWGRGSIGINTKLIIDEDQSNLTLGSVDNPLNDTASIERNEFFMYGNYVLTSAWQLNIVYKYASLEASDHYTNYWDYDTYFNYTTSGIVSSISWVPINNDHHLLWLNSGLTYTQADVEISETRNAIADDVYIDDTQNALGVKIGLGYTYKYSDLLNIRLSADWYTYDFGELNVNSHTIGGVFDKATLEESTYSVRLGVSYKF